jgi:hypothetical protein
MLDRDWMSYRAVARRGLTALVFFLVVGFIVGRESSLIPAQICVENPPESGDGGCTTYNIIYVPFVYTARFLNNEYGVLTAIATGFIGYLTYTLKRSTDRLWGEAEQQRRDAWKAHEASLEINRISANAAMLTAKNLLRTTRPLCVMEDLALEPFSGAVPDIELPEGYYLMSTYGTIANRGTANAFARDLQVVSSISEEIGEPLALGAKPNNLVFAFQELKFGESYRPSLSIHQTPVNEEFSRHETPLFVWGYLRYMDIHGVVRRSGFAFEWYHFTQGFSPCGGDDYWYDVEEEAKT